MTENGFHEIDECPSGGGCNQCDDDGTWCGENPPVLAPADDPVSHPAHYTFGKFEVIEVIEDWRLGFHLGNAVKYIARWDKKGDPRENLEKARWYIDRAIEKLTKCGVEK